MCSKEHFAEMFNYEIDTVRFCHRDELKTLPLITDHVSADPAVEAWERILGHKDSTLGVILEWG